MVGEAKKEYESLQLKTDQVSIRVKRTLLRYFEWFLLGGNLNVTQFKFQGHHKEQAEIVEIYAFKAYQYRIYGFRCTVASKNFFLGTSCDPKKKQDKADKQKIKKAAREVVSWVEKWNSGLNKK